jgi:two-component system, cell cycle sensor histidine kinase and response regulator CckA
MPSSPPPEHPTRATLAGAEWTHPGADPIELLLDRLPDVVVAFDDQRRVTYANAAFEAHTGRRRTALVGLPVDSLPLAAGAAARLVTAIEEAASRGASSRFTIALTTPDGATTLSCQILTTARREAWRGGVLVARDQSKPTAGAVGEGEPTREALWDAVVEATGQSIWRIGPNFELIEVHLHPESAFAREVAADGLTMEALRLRWFTRVHPDDLAGAIDGWLDAAAARRRFVFQFRMREEGEEYRTVVMRRVPLFDARGTLREWLGVIEDVSERIEVQESLRAAREQQLALLRAIPDLAWLKDVNGRYVAVNEALRARHGGVDLVGLGAAELFEPDLAAEFEEHDVQALAADAPVVREHEGRRGDGTIGWWETTKAPYRDASGAVAGIVAVSRDVTERRRLEDQVRAAQKMEALGLLASGVAHDFNNLLSAIMAAAELARLSIRSGTDPSDDVDFVIDAALRGAQLTGQLLAFSSRRTRQKRVVDVRQVVRGGDKLLHRLLPYPIVLDVVEAYEPCTVWADPGHLEQVLMNLVVNARDALTAAAPAPGVETITIRTARVDLEKGDTFLERREGAPLLPGAYVMLQVSDTGVGMSATTRDRSFDPFFTTKPSGRGTGLGLSTVLGIVNDHGGTVHVESAPNAGATFTVVLPWLDAPVDRSDEGLETLPRGSETILVVEDEAVVRETTTRVLRRYGYEVIAARHGADALLAWRDDPTRVDLVITDVRMPELGGLGLIEQLRAERPLLPVIVTSGYVNESDSAEAALIDREIFLPKPFTAESLLNAVRATLDALGGRG